MAPPRLRVLGFSLGAAFLILIAACSSSSQDSSSPDASDKCCPLSAPPTSCNTVFMGGSRAKNPSCGPYYDNVPPLTRSIDEDGCPTYGAGAPGQASVAVPYANDCPKRDAATD